MQAKGKKGIPGWAIALIVVGVVAVLAAVIVPVTCLVIMGTAAGGAYYMESKADEEREVQIQKLTEEQLATEMEQEQEAVDATKKLLLRLEELEGKSDLTDEELEEKKQIEELVEVLSGGGE